MAPVRRTSQIAFTLKLWPDRVLLPLAMLIAASPILFGFLAVARNRLLSGQPVGLFSIHPGLPVWFIGSGFVALLAGALAGRQSVALAGAAALSAGLTWTAGAHAAFVAATLPTARVSLGASYWVMQGLCLFAMAEAVRKHGPRGALLAFAMIVGPLAILVASGALDTLSLLREFANKQDILGPAFLRHISIVATAMVPTLLIGLPLGVACHRSPGLGRAVFPALGLVQTIPSIALFGLLMAPLSGLANMFPALQQAGISGIGVAPAVIALVLYSLLPITRNTTSGLDGVPAPVRDAARGLGMTASQSFWQVDVRLAMPAVVAGLRITLVQAIGLAAVAALIGAGGLGSVMFDGLFAGAVDLVLLGALPVITLAVTADLLLRLAVPVRVESR